MCRLGLLLQFEKRVLCRAARPCFDSVVFCAHYLLLALTGLQAGTRYEIIRLPTPPNQESFALGVNGSGDVAGYRTEGNVSNAFLYAYATGALSDLGSLGGNQTVACAVNDARQVTGHSFDSTDAIMQAFVVSPDRRMAALPAGPNGVHSEGWAINQTGQVGGAVEDAQGQSYPVLFAGGIPVALADPAPAEDLYAVPCAAYGVNEAGDLVGTARKPGEPGRAFLYSASQKRFQDLGTLGGKASQAYAVNRRGDVAGEADTNADKVHAFVYAAGRMRDLGTLTGFDAASRAWGLNDDGLAVGESAAADGSKHAFVTEDLELVDLNSAAANLTDAGFTSLDVARGVNGRGWVVGWGTTKEGKSAAFLAVPNGPEAAAPKAGTYDAFYTQLSPKDGQWLDVGVYGHAFRPNVAAGSANWRPYRDGHWVQTDHGWYWYSNEPFGWATYHYGGWIYLTGVGWCWIPGRHWAPSWVSWRRGEDCVGWAPLPPEAVCVEGNEVLVTSACDASFGIGPGAYTFIDCKDWLRPTYVDVSYADARAIEIIQSTANVTDIYAGVSGFHSYGVDTGFLSQRLGRPIPRVSLEVATAASLGGAFHAALAGNALEVTVPALHLASTANVRPPLRIRILDPRSERGWASVPPDRLGGARAALASRVLGPYKPFAVSQPIGPPPHHPHLPGALPRRSPGSLSVQPLPHLAHLQGDPIRPTSRSGGPGPKLPPGEAEPARKAHEGPSTNHDVAYKEPVTQPAEHPRGGGGASVHHLPSGPERQPIHQNAHVNLAIHQTAAANRVPHEAHAKPVMHQMVALNRVARPMGAAPPRPPGASPVNRRPPAPKPTPHIH